eukprot:1037568-Lingulodinium_polyedra.AAC.1
MAQNHQHKTVQRQPCPRGPATRPRGGGRPCSRRSSPCGPAPCPCGCGCAPLSLRSRQRAAR